MKKILVLVIIVFCILKISSQNNCYIIKGEYSGKTTLHTPMLFDSACSYVTSYNDFISRNSSSRNVTSDFKIVTEVHYPIIGSLKPEYSFPERTQMSISEIKVGYPQHLGIIKEVHSTGIKFKCSLALPLNIYANIDEVKLEAIRFQVESTINSGYILFNGNSVLAEILGFAKLKELLGKLESGNLNIDIWDLNEFYKTKFSNISEIHSASENKTIENNGRVEIHNYGSYYQQGESIIGLTSSVNQIEFLNKYDLSILIIFSSKNDNSKISEISNLFKNSNKTLKLWIHFDHDITKDYTLKNSTPGNSRETVAGDVYFKLDNKMDKTTAEKIVFDSNKSNLALWTEETTGNPPPADCSIGWKLGWKCMLPRSNEWAGSGPINDGIAGVLSGLVDGLLGTLEGFYNAAKSVDKSASTVWASLTNFVVSSVENGIDYEALKKATYETVSGAYESFKQFSKSIVEIGEVLYANLSFERITQFAIAIKEGIFGLITEALENPNIGKMVSYGVGLVMFAVVANYLTAGAANAVKGENCAKFIEYFKKGPSAIKNWITSIFANTSELNTCKTIFQCFGKDTKVWCSSGIDTLHKASLIPLLLNIQDVKIDNYVKSYRHPNDYYLSASNENSSKLTYDDLEITPETWQIGKFKLLKGENISAYIEANRPKSWYIDRSISNLWDTTFLNFPELGIFGKAVLYDIVPTNVNTRNSIINNEGINDRPIITTIRSYSTDIRKYYFDDGTTISSTPSHPFFSIDRNTYVPISELSFSEKVLTNNGFSYLCYSDSSSTSDTVYNFEVWRDHNYYVGDSFGSLFLVHNGCAWEKYKKYLDDAIAWAKVRAGASSRLATSLGKMPSWCKSCEAHHLFPISRLKNPTKGGELFRRAINGGFDPDHSLNGRWVEKAIHREDNWDHKSYNKMVDNLLEKLAEDPEYINASEELKDAKARELMSKAMDRLHKFIDEAEKRKIPIDKLADEKGGILP